MANTTIDDAVRRFNARSFVTSNLLTEIQFDAQLNTTLTQFIQSTSIDYNRLLDIIHLVTQVDQHYAGLSVWGTNTNFNAQISIKATINETSGQKSWQVCHHSKENKMFHSRFTDESKPKFLAKKMIGT